MPHTVDSLTARQRVFWAAAAALLAATVVVALAPVLDNGFVWDDGANLVHGRRLWGEGWRGLAWSFTHPLAGHYQPLTWLSYRADLALSGLSPGGVHATNLALHLAVTALVALLALRLPVSFGRSVERSAHRAFAWLAAALFALHPMRVETVAWATERRDLLGAAFALAAVAVYLRRAVREPLARTVGPAVVALHAASALSRAQLTLPLVLLVLDWWPLRRTAGLAGAPRRRAVARLWMEKLPLFAVAALSAALAAWAQRAQGAFTPLAEHGLWSRLVQAGYGLAFYPAALLGRRNWSPLYDRPVPFEPWAPWLLLPALATVAGGFALWSLRRRWPGVAAAAAAYALLVLPVLGLSQAGVQRAADRYGYQATIPLCLLLAWAVVAAWLRWHATAWRLALAAAVVAVLVLWGVEAHGQTRVWHDDETLWRHVLTIEPSALAENNLAYLLLARGRLDEAALHFERSLARTPTYSRPWPGVVAVLEADAVPSDRTRALAETLERARMSQPARPQAHYAAGLAWAHAAERKRSRQALERAVALAPQWREASLALAVARQVADDAGPPAAGAPRR